MEQLLTIGRKLGSIPDENIVFPLSTALSQYPDQLRLIVVFFFQYPLGWAFYYFAHGTIGRHLFAIFFGMMIQFYMYGTNILHVFLITAVAHAIMALCDRQKQHKYVMIWVFFYLSYLHVERQLTDYGSYDIGITTHLMCHVLKL